MYIYKRLAISTVCVLACGALTFAAVGASVENISVDASTATVRIVNNSTKDISAYTLAIDLTLANGRTIHSERLEDYLPIPENANKLWHPGTTREQVVPFTADSPVTKSEAKIAAIIYADRTADVADTAAYQRMIDSRTERAAAMTQEAKAIQTALADPNPTQKASENIKQLLYEAKASGKGNDGELTVTLQWLQDAPKAAARANMNEGEYLKAYADQMNRLASATAEQAIVRRNP
jgi:hypothetical protein